MKKKMLAFTLTFALCSVPFSAFAEDSAVTAESVLEAMQEYQTGVDSLTSNMTMNLDAALKMSSEDSPETSIGFSMDGAFSLREILKPMKMAMKGDYKISVLGQNQDASMEMYGALSDDEKTLDTYVNMTAAGEESGWQHTTMDFEELLKSFGADSLNELSNMNVNEIFGDNVTLNWELEENDSAYLLSAVLNFSELMPMIEEAMKASGEEIPEEEMGLAEDILSSLVMNMTYTIDKETYAQISTHIDFNDSDLTVLNELLAAQISASSGEDSEASIPNMELALNDFSMDMSYSFDDVDEILIPEEAYTSEAINVNDLMEEAADLAEETTEE